jgi:hypothetical protein
VRPYLLAILDDWAAVRGQQDDLAVLAKSYSALPSDAHRRMFLDAALLLHQQPAQHLTALWEAQLGLDESLSCGELVFRGSGWRTRQEAHFDVSDEQRGQRQRDDCRLRADKLLQDLISTSLVSQVADIDSYTPFGYAPIRQARHMMFHTWWELHCSQQLKTYTIRQRQTHTAQSS